MSGPATDGAPAATPTPPLQEQRPPSALHVLTRPPLLLLHVAGTLAVVAAFLLGQWQVDAWREHRADTGNRLAHETPRPLDSVLGPDDPYPRDDVGRPVDVSGTWLTDQSVYVEGRLHDATEGYWLVTPLVACAEGQDCAEASAVPVVVGWTREPQATPPTGRADVVGWLQPPEQDDALDPDPDDDVLPMLRVRDLLDRVDHDLYSGYVILDQPAEARGDLVAVTPDSLPKPPASTALRNLLYGIEWWIFGGFAAFLWWRWCRDAVLEARAPTEPEAGTPRLPSAP